MTKPALGRGLGALLGGASQTTQQTEQTSSESVSSEEIPAHGKEGEATPAAPEAAASLRVPLSRIYPSPFQPRKDYPEESLQELAASIQEQGIIQPLIVRQRAEGYELIAGERRWRAAQRVGLEEVPVIVRETDDHSVLELMLVENLQREDLNAIEEALGYAELMERFQLTQEDVAARVGKSRAAVANALRLLRLGEKVQTLVREGRLAVGHAKAILGLSQADDQDRAAEQVVEKGLSVRQTEELVSGWGKPPSNGRSSDSKPGRSSGSSNHRDPHLASLETQLQERLGTKVTLRYREGKGAIEIRFFNDTDLERVLDLLGVRPD